jgi:uncharacterized membrane protein YheB (UPF0754 family)
VIGTDYPWYLLALIPIISSTIGYVTNVFAVKMMFHPVHFIGIRPIGWQGIIPANSVKLSRSIYRLINTQLLKFPELFDADETDKLLASQSDRIRALTERVVREQGETRFAPMWNNLDTAAREQVIELAFNEVMAVSRKIIDRLVDDIDSFIDLEPIVIGSARDNIELMGRIFLEVGRAEFKFIERSGLYFGFVFGLVQLVVWIVFPVWWILPLFGFIVGYVTNYLAIKLIFEPRDPKRILGLTVQGLFHRRQKQVAADFSQMVADNVLTDEALFQQLTTEKSRARLLELVSEASGELVERYKQNPLVGALVTDEMARSIEAEVLANVEAEVFRPDGPLVEVAHRSTQIKEILGARMADLPPEPFENVLRPAFKQDEWKLIIMGAILGLGAGVLQLVYIFGDALVGG